MINFIDGGICAPKGFLASGVYAGIRKNTSKLDLAIIYSEIPAMAAGVFTLNLAKAAPVILTQKNIQKNGLLQAMVINSGNANACTGTDGFLHAEQMIEVTAKNLNIESSLVGVASTGVIGVTLPINKIIEGIETAASKLSLNSNAAAQAIMTTDTFSKSVAVEVLIGEKNVRIGGIAKGSGMIHPNMATMLSFITTDALIDQKVLQEALSKANQISFNMITVDGDTSTNDTVVVLANGCAQNLSIKSLDSIEGNIFYEAICQVMQHLSKEIARDGEGASKLIEVNVHNALTESQARMAARAVCGSSLLKAAIFGEDANWGRIVNALGYSGATIKLELLTIKFDDLCLFKNGVPIVFDEDVAKKILSQKNVFININLGLGTSNATAWGCDLSYDYVKINASYRT